MRDLSFWGEMCFAAVIIAGIIAAIIFHKLKPTNNGEKKNSKEV